MKLTVLAVLSCLSFGMIHAEVPELFRQKAFTAATLATAVNHFVELGENDAVRELIDLAPRWKADGRPERVAWMCRILFSPNGQTPLRQPAYGSLNLPYLSMPLAHWPLYPIAAAGQSYFVLSEGYALGGIPGNPVHFLEYCRQAGVFRTHPIPVPTRAEAQKDVLALHQSPAWKAIRWKDHGEGTRYVLSEEQTWKFVQTQADSIP
jgi:hypothetical protein